jgi:hypothetical protein
MLKYRWIDAKPWSNFSVVKVSRRSRLRRWGHVLEEKCDHD